MSWILIAILIIVGLIFLILEVLVIPGTTLAALVGFGLITAGIWQAYAVHGSFWGSITLGSTLVLTVLLLYFSLKSRTWKRMELKTSIDGRVNVLDENSVATGDTGITISRLAPSGNATIRGNRFEVHTFGEFIDPGTEIRVVNITDNKIFVTKKS
jgi:membrane-bound ClpP family serine protease